MISRQIGIVLAVSINALFLVADVACGIAAAPLPSPATEQDYVTYFENELAKASSDDDKAMVKRKLIRALISVADQRAPKGSTSARVKALARVDSLYKELEDRSPGSQDSYRDYFDHAYFLANHGFGEPIPFSYYLRRPEPDYPRALTLYEKASGTADLKLREQARSEIDKILAPVLYIGKVHYSDNNLVLAFAVRNLDLVLMKLECHDQSVNVIQQWSINFAASLDHEVQIHYYRIERVPECRALVATASSLTGVTQSFVLAPGDKQLWSGRQDPVNDYQTRKVVEAVSEVAVPEPSRVFRQHHSCNQTCSLCHIPHNAGE